MKTYRIRLYRKGQSLSYETYYAKALNEGQAIDKAIIQLQSIDNGAYDIYARVNYPRVYPQVL